jgi:hypothetical protein
VTPVVSVGGLDAWHGSGDTFSAAASARLEAQGLLRGRTSAAESPKPFFPAARVEKFPQGGGTIDVEQLEPQASGAWESRGWLGVVMRSPNATALTISKRRAETSDMRTGVGLAILAARFEANEPASYRSVGRTPGCTTQPSEHGVLPICRKRRSVFGRAAGSSG